MFISEDFCKLELKKKQYIVKRLKSFFIVVLFGFWGEKLPILLQDGFASSAAKHSGMCSADCLLRLSGSLHCWLVESNFCLLLLLSSDLAWFRFLLFVLSFVTCYMLDKSCMGFMRPFHVFFSAKTTTCCSCIFVMKLSASSSLFCLARWVVSRLSVQSSAAMLFTVILH